MANSNSIKKKNVELIRQLGLFDSAMIVVGTVIGSGIFLTTGIMAQTAPSAKLILIAWIVGGLLSLAGGLIFAELGAAMPKAGGQYVYLKEAYGPLFGFLYGWILFLVYITGCIAALAVAFAEYFGYFFPSLSTNSLIFSTEINVYNHNYPYSLSKGQVVAIVVVILFSVINYIGVGFGKAVQNILTVIKIGTIGLFITLGFTIGKGASIDFSLNPTGLSFGKLIIGFGIALVAVAWTIDGWHNINLVAGEIKNPKRNLPYSLIFGALIITVLYILVNYIYLYALPIEEMAGVVRIGEKATNALFGKTSAGIISAAVIISVIGSLNAKILTGPRVYYAMAKDKLFFKKVGDVHPRFLTPGFAIFIQAVWACILTLTGTFEQLFTFVMFVAIMFWVAAATSVFTLRKKYPHHPRPYRIWAYPVTPILFIAVSLAILINTLFEKPVESLSGIALIAIGIPIYYYWKRKSNLSSKDNSDLNNETKDEQ